VTQYRVPRPVSATLNSGPFGGTPDILTLRFNCQDQSAYWIHWEMGRGVWSLWRASSDKRSVVGLASGTGSFVQALDCLSWE